MKKKLLKRSKIYISQLSFDDLKLFLASTEKGLAIIDFNSDELDFIQSLTKKFGEVEIIKDPQHNKAYGKEINDYFLGNTTKFTVALDLIGTDFQKQVWQALMDIPYGETTSYKEIANKINNPNATRAVGMANNKNTVPIIIPCHRVIGADGSLVGYGGGLHIKEKLLQLEGIKIDNQKVVK
ncbi:methylated-DNA--[protein]-cysteine S-methyltransferase [Alkaliphilus hydrothermalis]|uniref:Methylated-DNA--protein-cysteine methyltransferase n=1 Tax=Alkaliphilus hydrothermalis TaxID=1482730 RepID=A0ABS2NNA7_9FIRM|nr:methylated-DNA--[protein]-cysteine S-methyltransferase [Alkaliphilus hydrothermalis]MBM7614418.1 methylated-DNA-[protein]-cysteine S-methyltransferase [Alkaliphilus hydrothermalis]